MMKLKAIILLLTFTQGVCKVLEVLQDPKISVPEGETAHLRCNFSSSGNSTIGAFKWYRAGTPAAKGKEVNNDTHPRGIIRVDQEAFIRDKDASISILETVVSYQDTYYCEVDLIGEKGTGNGTLLIVRNPENNLNKGSPSGNYIPLWTTVLLIVLSVVTFILMIGVILHCSRRRQQTETPLQNQPQLRQEVCYSEIPRDASPSNQKRNKKQTFLQEDPQENTSVLQYAQLNVKKNAHRHLRKKCIIHQLISEL